MSALSDSFEIKVAARINEILSNDWTASRPVASTYYSDVKIEKKTSSIWLEVKMNPTDNLGNPRVSYFDGQWVYCGLRNIKGDISIKTPKREKPLAMEICNHLNNSNAVKKYINELVTWYNKNYDSPIKATPKNIILYTSTSKSFYTKQVSGKIIITPKILLRFISEKHPGDQYIYKNNTEDVSKLVRTHYLKGKNEPAFFLQCGETKFFKLYENQEELKSAGNFAGISNILRDYPKLKNVPTLKGTGIFNVRFSFRGGNTIDTIRSYEIQPEVKILRLENTSQYSVFNNSSNTNPFIIKEK